MQLRSGEAAIDLLAASSGQTHAGDHKNLIFTAQRAYWFIYSF